MSLRKLSTTRPPFEDRDVKPFDWYALVDACVHQVKVAIAEALDWIGQPLSAKELQLVLGKYDYHTVVYHAARLEKQGLTAVVDKREVRGAVEIYYLPSRADG